MKYFFHFALAENYLKEVIFPIKSTSISDVYSKFSNRLIPRRDLVMIFRQLPFPIFPTAKTWLSFEKLFEKVPFC